MVDTLWHDLVIALRLLRKSPVFSAAVVLTLLFGGSGHDPLTLIGIATVLGSVAIIACAIPAWRAARVDPTISLRSE